MGPGTGLTRGDDAVTVDPDEVRQVVEAVFADDAYREIAQPISVRGGVREWIEQIREAIWDGIGAFQSWISDLSITSPILFGLLMAFMLIVLCLILAHAIYSARMAFSVRWGSPAPQPEEKEERRSAYREILEQAHALAREGAFAEGIRTLLLALFALVGRRRPKLVLDGWTNHEVVDRIPIDEADRDRLEELAITVDRVWYGRGSASQSDFDRAASIVESVARS